ncbi:GNAT family N-acetyltransferase [Flavobacterium crassostreae]|uniref:Phosphinothricin acetyltransferase n=1 Tax=Flavobacterium crassostreae TaxID=1763534 RepID=A0A1B9DN62_9FLAO|nr:GNAT family N-acetyltransferase [Flavobacterium crassostreae]OCB71140.1 phosphinothricin acetyltransferase [Flavobacterium crassostreae]
MEMLLRNYKTQDTQAIVAILNYHILHSTALYDYEPRTYAQQKALLEDKINNNFPVIVAEFAGKVVGFGMYSEFRFKEAYKFTVEHSVYVANEFHGKGLGKQLLEALIVVAKKQGLHTMIAVIDAENQSSIVFHEKYGFKTVGILKETGYKFNRWLDSVFMQLILK